MKSTLAKLEQTLLGAAAPVGDNSNWHKLPSPPGAPTIEWGFRDKYLIVGIGAGSAEAIAKRRGGEPPAWLTAVKKYLPVERVSTVHYLNVKKLVAATAPMMGPQGQAIVDALGLGNVRQFANVSGLEGTGCLSKSWVQVDGEPNGLLSLFGAEPLTAADLRPIPKDASFAAVARVAHGPALGDVRRDRDEDRRSIGRGACERDQANGSRARIPFARRFARHAWRQRVRLQFAGRRRLDLHRADGRRAAEKPRPAGQEQRAVGASLEQSDGEPAAEYVWRRPHAQPHRFSQSEDSLLECGPAKECRLLCAGASPTSS